MRAHPFGGEQEFIAVAAKLELSTPRPLFRIDRQPLRNAMPVLVLDQDLEAAEVEGTSRRLCELYDSLAKPLFGQFAGAVVAIGIVTLRSRNAVGDPRASASADIPVI